MKTKLFYLLIAVFAFSFVGHAQYPVITLMGSGNGGWTDDKETPMITEDGITYNLVDKVLTDGAVKFREGRCWTSGCPSTVTNPYGWGPTDAQFAIDGGWPSGANPTPVDGGKDILCKAGSWTITFNRILGSWSFVPGTPLPVIKLVGSAVTATDGALLTTADGIVFTAKKVSLKPGICQFNINGTIYGGTTFPTGSATSTTEYIPVSTTGIDYDITFDFTTAEYVFKVATFPQVALVGAAVGGWPPNPQPEGYVDQNVMTTTDGVTYTLTSVPVIPGGMVFRQDNAWNVKYGNVTFPDGTGGTGADIIVPEGDTGTYNVSLITTTKTYDFNKITYSIVGDGVGGWPPSPQPEGYVDPYQLSTVDGVNYTIDNLVVVGGGVKFRLNNAWAGGDWGGDTFPDGTKSGSNIPTVAGTYNLTVNVLTGTYDFGTSLSTKNFTIAGLKMYPNPTQNNWTISANEQITSVQVFDILGKSVYNNTFSSSEVNVSAAKLSRGVYFAKISTAKGSSNVKLVKE